MNAQGIRIMRAPLSAALAVCCAAAAMAAPAPTHAESLRSSFPFHARAGAHQRAEARTATDRPAAVVPVTSCADDGSAGTLRSVVTGAASGTTVDLSALACSTITLTQGAIFFYVDDLALHGPLNGGVTISGGDADSVLVGYGNGTLAIDHLSIAHGGYGGVSYANGGCLYFHGDVTLDTDVFSTCTVGIVGTTLGYGGAIFAGGGISASSSTITTSFASQGGGGIVALGPITLSDSTVSGNTSGSVGAGIIAYAGISAHNSTIAFNTAQYGGGGIWIHRPGYATELQSTIVADNTIVSPGFGAADIGSSYDGSVTGANNLIVASDFAVPGDTLTADPQLMPLANNGGLTPTLALAATSPAIDAGNNVDALAFDQRGDGYARVAGIAADIGAFETQPMADRIFVNGFDNPAR